MTSFVISDTHFCHEKALEFRPQFGTLEEMNGHILELWNQTVRPGDNVFHLGDLMLCGGDPVRLRMFDEVMQQLHGTIHLVMGNHDNYSRVEPYVDKISGCLERKQYLLTHMPVHPNQQYRYKKNIHGHLHSDVVRLPDEHPELGWPRPDAFRPGPDPWYRLSLIHI